MSAYTFVFFGGLRCRIDPHLALFSRHDRHHLGRLVGYHGRRGPRRLERIRVLLDGAAEEEEGHGCVVSWWYCGGGDEQC